jgi:hypothetical protein
MRDGVVHQDERILRPRRAEDEIATAAGALH